MNGCSNVHRDKSFGQMIEAKPVRPDVLVSVIWNPLHCMSYMHALLNWQQNKKETFFCCTKNSVHTQLLLHLRIRSSPAKPRNRKHPRIANQCNSTPKYAFIYYSSLCIFLFHLALLFLFLSALCVFVFVCVVDSTQTAYHFCNRTITTALSFEIVEYIQIHFNNP